MQTQAIYNYTFKRIEKKYLLSEEQYMAFVLGAMPYLTEDIYGVHKIRNMYYDTKDFALIRHSIEKPDYKEKLRLRCYGNPTEDSTVYLELKKKVDHIVYKRRVGMPFKVAMEYLESDTNPDIDYYLESSCQAQIINEINYLKDFYQLLPKMYLSYDRVAYSGTYDHGLRLTFDTDIKSREEHLSFLIRDYGEHLLPTGCCLMEIKVPYAYPLWLASLLSDLKIYPISFSKYGKAYENSMERYFSMIREGLPVVQENLLTIAKQFQINEERQV